MKDFFNYYQLPELHLSSTMNSSKHIEENKTIPQEGDSDVAYWQLALINS